MSRINIRYHKKQFPAIVNSLSIAMKKCVSYPWVMSTYEIRCMEERVELVQAINQVCMLTALPYEQVREYVESKSVCTGHRSLNIARDLTHAAIGGFSVKNIIAQGMKI